MRREGRGGGGIRRKRRREFLSPLPLAVFPVRVSLHRPNNLDAWKKKLKERNSKYSKNNKFNNDCKLTQKYAIKYRKNKQQQIKRKLRLIKKKGKEGPIEVRKLRKSKKKKFLLSKNRR